MTINPSTGGPDTCAEGSGSGALKSDSAPTSSTSASDTTGEVLLSARDVSVGYGYGAIVKGVSHDFAPGCITSIIGPNGCGKSTFLRVLSRHLRPMGGQVTLNGTTLTEYAGKQLARRVGMLPQSPIAPDGIAVADLVGRGRTPHQGFLGRWSKADYEAVASALQATGVAELAERPVDELSGGQRQRVWIAMALAQQTDILLLDEPTTYLDLKHQVEVLDLLTDLNRERGTTIIMVLHDLNLAARYSDYLLAMRDGTIRAAGTAPEVMDAGTLRAVFDLESEVIDDPVTGMPAVMPIGRHHAPCPSPALSHN